MVSFKTFFNLILEDLQSSINQGTKILTSNEFTPEEASQAVGKIKGIMDEVGRGVPNQQKRFNTDSNIPILSYILLALKDAGGDPYVKLKREYQTYLASEEATKKKILTVAFDTLRNEIQGKKLFKPSPEKIQIIISWGTNLIEEIHKYIKADETEDAVVRSDEDIVYENDEIVVYRADSRDKCIAYGAGSNLCISTKGGGNFYWAYRMGEMRRSIDGLGMTTYFVFWKDTNERILIDALGDNNGPANEYSWNNIEKDGTYDNVDEDITPEELIEMHPELKEPFSKNVFQFIPYGEDERRFIDIQKNVNYIDDSQLRTLKDYEMFLEGKDPDDYSKIFISSIYWRQLERRLSEDEIKILVKKYIALGFNSDIATQDRYLSEADKKWHLKKVFERDDAGFVGYIDSVNFVVPDIFIKRIIECGSYDCKRVVRDFFTGIFGGISRSIDFINDMSTEFKMNIITGNITDDVLNILKKVFDDYNPYHLIVYYMQRNKIPKELYPLILKSPYLSLKVAHYWHNKKRNVPNILIKSIIKDPKIALSSFNLLSERNKYGRLVAPDYLKRAIFKNPRTKYEFIRHVGGDERGFELYPASEIADLFSQEDLGLRYALENEGFGIYKKEYDKNNTQNYSKVRKVIYANILKNGKKIYNEIYLKAYHESSDIYKMLKKSLDRYEAKLNKDT